MLVVPSPKFQSHWFMVPEPAIEESVKLTSWRTVGSVEDITKSAWGGVFWINGSVTVIVFVIEADIPLESVTVSVIDFSPAVEYTCVGFCWLLVIPSPKVHDHKVIVPYNEVDLSVKITCWRTVGLFVDIENSTDGCCWIRGAVKPCVLST